jgi:hypothetical protein
MNKLSNIPDKNPFKVPDNYFEEVNRKIISATAGFDQEVRKVRFYSRFRTSLLIAASVAGFILISYTAIKILTPDNKKSQVSEVLSAMNPDIYINDIDISSLEEDASSFIAPEAGQDVSRKDIIDYLMFENIEVNDIYEQL